ncbi:hypothetical protein [Kiloniella sp.]|uniref:hypothetical protein n=1 Tax=Kiloniella sp. TaxID=1938587 RepID=UPI003B01F783
MTQAPSSYSTQDPDIFSRGSLNFTYELLKKSDAELALTIRNIIHGDPLPKGSEDLDTKDSDHFRVILDGMQVRSVLEGLTLQNQQNQGSQHIGQAIMAQALIEDWIKLAHQMISELPEDQRAAILS